MSGIGGFFELELRKGKEFHAEALGLNSGKNSLIFLLQSRKLGKIYIPIYTCEVIRDVCDELGLAYEYYSLDNDLNPVIKSSIRDEDALLYTNYFGIKQKTVNDLAEKFRNLIIDNAQSFFSLPLKGVDTFYSARKFFGVPDGGYLYTSVPLACLSEVDRSGCRLKHLVKRIEEGPEAGYRYFLENENNLAQAPVRLMSKLTQRLLCNIDYEAVINMRRENFLFLHEKLNGTNLFRFEPDIISVPMIYPYLCDKGGLRDHLISNRIFVAKYWPSVLNIADRSSIEYFFADNLIPLPIDQRYEQKDMEIVASEVLKYV